MGTFQYYRGELHRPPSRGKVKFRIHQISAATEIVVDFLHLFLLTNIIVNMILPSTLLHIQASDLVK